MEDDARGSGRFRPTAKVLADSVADSSRLTTMVIEFHRYILPEFLTHRMFSRNGASLRAMPIRKVLERVKSSNVEPLHWGAIKGDNYINYHPDTWTTDDTSYEDYALVANGFQRIMDATGLGHRHSHCFYGKTFDAKQLVKYYNNPGFNRIKSLYYRLPYNANVASLRKDALWQEVKDNEIVDFDVDALLKGGSCQTYSSDPACECAA